MSPTLWNWGRLDIQADSHTVMEYLAIRANYNVIPLY